MSQAMEFLKSWLLQNGAAPYAEQTAAEMAGRSDDEPQITAARMTVSMALERHGMTPVMASGLASAFAELVRERARKVGVSPPMKSEILGKKQPETLEE